MLAPPAGGLTPTHMEILDPPLDLIYLCTSEFFKCCPQMLGIKFLAYDNILT